jgi:hypothetical protein
VRNFVDIRRLSAITTCSVPTDDNTTKQLFDVLKMASEAEVDNGPMRLKDREIYWRDHQVWLQECGYMLRPRYLPSWIPSWKTDPTKVDLFCEDGIPLSVSEVNIPGSLRLELYI